MGAWRMGVEAAQRPAILEGQPEALQAEAAAAPAVAPAPVSAAPAPAPAPAPLAEGAGDGGEKPFKEVFDKLTKWIPSDTLALYAPGVTAIATQTKNPSVLLLVIMIVVTPLFVLLAAWSTGKVTKRVWATALLGCVAFAIWSLSVPQSGWQSWSLVSQNGAFVAVGAAIVGILFGYFAEGVVKRIPQT